MTALTPPPQVWPTLRAHDALALIRFLVDVVGFEETVVYADDEEVHHAQLSWPAGGGVMLGSARPEDPTDPWPVQPGSFGAYVVTDDPDSLFARVSAAGAEIIAGLRDTDYGSRDFALRDPEGNRWSFGTYRGEPRPTVGGSAADRFRDASRSRDVARASEELAEQVVLYNPMSDLPVLGRAAVAAALAALNDVFDTFEHVGALNGRTVSAGSDGVELQGIRFRANFAGQTIDGVDLLEVDSDDRIRSITVLARPLSALQSLGQVIAARRARP